MVVPEPASKAALPERCSMQLEALELNVWLMLN